VEHIKINDLSAHNDALKDALYHAAKKVIDSGWFAMGPELDQFECSFATYCGADFCAGVASGTDALEIGLKALGVKPGDEVITVANAGMYACTAIQALGAVPVFADIDLPAMTISPDHIRELISSKTRAVIATHLFGRMCDMPRIIELANAHNLVVLEDCAQAHGAVLEGKKAGSWGNAGAFSFYPTKNLGALGDGGAIVCQSADTHEKIKRLRQYGWRKKYQVTDAMGCNSRLDEIQAAFLNVKLPYLDQWLQKRQSIGHFFSEHISHPAVELPDNTPDHVFHLYVLRCSNREALREHLMAKGVATEIHYPILDYQQPVFAQMQNVPVLPNSEKVLSEIVTIPCFPELSSKQQSYIVEAINAWQS